MFLGDVWLKPETLPCLRSGEIHVWRVDLSRPVGRALLPWAAAALTKEERQRTARMRSGTAPEEFITGRGFLRHLLGLVLHCDPHGIVFALGPHRKPELRPVPGMKLPLFNVSHSRGIVLIALSGAGEVGVDVEYMDATLAAMDLARAAFHVEDIARIGATESDADRLRAFYRCWTQREAIAKADGRGLTLPASGYEIGGCDDGEHRVDLAEDTGASRAFYVRGLDVGAMHLGALATVCPRVDLKLFDPACLSLLRPGLPQARQPAGRAAQAAVTGGPR